MIANVKQPICLLTVYGGDLTHPFGTLSSPGYTERKDYPPNSDITWNITVEADKFVHIIFYYFELEAALGVICYFDYIWLFDEEGEVGK